MKWFCTLLFFGVFHFTWGQQAISWETLSRVEFDEYFDRDLNEWMLQGRFSEEVKALNQQRVILKGYVIPLDVSGQEFALSAFPFSSCYFCGGAGPETVLKIELSTDAPSWETDDYVELIGRFILKSKPGLEFHYTLQVEEGSL